MSVRPYTDEERASLRACGPFALLMSENFPMLNMRWEATLAARDAELAALRAEIERLTAGLETIVALTKHDEPGVGEVFSPGGVEAVLVLKGTNRPLERMNEKLAALRLRYREALEVMNHLYRNVLGPASPKCDGCAEEIAEALAQINPVLSTPEAIAIIKEGQS